MGVFWKCGYAGASLPTLLDSMGIARGSFYKAFGSKKDLFVLTLDRYDVEVVRPAIDMLKRGAGSGLDRIVSVFEGSLQRALDGDRTGCLLCNTAAENGNVDLDIANKIEDQLARLTDGFATALRDDPAWAAATEGTRSAQANSLMMSYVGLRILAKSGGADALRQSVERTLSALQRAP